MGTNCSTKPEVDTTNQCFVSVGDRGDVDHFCTFLGPAGNGFRNEYCRLLSNGGEWGNAATVNNGCQYDDCRPYIDFGFGCCNGCCGIIGGGLSCERLKFTGDPTTCCFNDLACAAVNSDNPSQCYSDQAKQNACADGNNGQPNYRSVISSDCRDVLLQYCTGTLATDDPNSTAWLSRWTANGGGTGSCSYALFRNITAEVCPLVQPQPTPGICNIRAPFPINAEGYFWGQRLISAAMAQYTEQGFQLGTLPGFPGYNPWQDFIYSTVCCPYPGLCQDGLNTVCATQTSQRISLNPAVAQWCGCHLPEGEYQSYSTLYNIPPQCTPMCNRAGTIPIVGINGDAINCTQNICLIDGVTVNLVNSQVGNGLNFNQICGNCVNSQCSCVVSNTTVDIINSTIGGNLVPIAEGCGSFTCSQTNPGNTGPAIIPVACGTGPFNPYAQYEAEVAAAQATAKKSSWLWTLVAVGIALIIIYLIILFIHPNLYPSEGTTIPIQKPYNPQFTRDSSGFSSVEGTNIITGATNTSTENNSSESFVKSSPDFQSIEDR